jgi:hypothetical protein
MKTSKTLIWATVGMMLLAVGCGSARKTSQTAEPVPQTPPDLQSPAGTMHEAAAIFDVLSFGAQITLGMGGTENVVNGTFRIKKDSLIWISARKFGFEIGRLMVSADSVWLLNRVNNEYFKGNYLFFSQQFKLDIDYNMLEALLLGNPLENWSHEPVQTDCTRPLECVLIYPQRYRINQGVDGSMRPEGSTVTRQEVAVSRNTGRLLRNLIEVTDARRRITATYDQFLTVNEMLLPQQILLVVNDQDVETSIKIEADTYTAGGEMAFPFNIPRSYKPFNIR